LSGVGTIVNLMGVGEVEEFERLNGLAPLEEVVAKEHKSIRAWLKVNATSCLESLV
jgi:translation initiation factor 2 alpha subunit (eIF-2alpha)